MSTITVTAPFDGKVIKELTLQTKEEVEQAINLAHETFIDQDRWLPKYQRVAILEKVVEIMKGRIEELTLIAAQEGGKPYMDSKVEVERAINGVKLAIEHIGHLEGKEIAMGHTASSANRLAFTTKEPIGVVAAISAFNHPLNLAIHQTVPAIAVGAPVIIKPALSTPLSTLNFMDILYEAGLPKAFCQAVVCEDSVAEFLATHPKVNYLTFIGSAKVGWYLNSKVSPGTRVGLEHGGVAPVIVEPDADITELIPALAKGGFYHAGQVCVSVQRIYVHETIIDDVANQLTEAAKRLRVGDPLDPKTEVGPIILHRETDRIDSWVKGAIESGAKLMCGGNKIGETCYEPTVLVNPSKDSDISTKEIFGPVIALYPYSDLDEAIAASNSLEFAFQASIFTKNIDNALKAVKRINATAVMVNDHTAFRVDWMPFGGRDASGLGLGGIPYSMEEMTRDKMMVIKSNVL